LLVGAFTRNRAGHFVLTMDAPGRISGRAEAAESSMPRSNQAEERSVRWYASTARPGLRRRQAKAIQPRQAAMVRMRSSSIPIKGSNR
jgi:hypothetical protein